MVERKCTSCGTWNKGEDYCSNCNGALSPKALDKVYVAKKRQEEAERPKSKTDIFIEKAKNSESFMVKTLYYFFYSVFLIFGAIGGFLAWLVAMANG